MNDYPEDCWIEVKSENETFLVYAFFPFVITNSKYEDSLCPHVVVFFESDWKSVRHKLTKGDIAKFFGIESFSADISRGLVCIQDLVVNTATDAVNTLPGT